MIYEATEDNLRKASQALISGDLVAFPTETVYGLGANATDAIAVQKIFSVKGRPSNNPLIVHVADIKGIELVAEVPPNTLIASRLSKLKHFWPGPLSIVLPKVKSLPKIVTAGGDTVAVRIPSHPIALKLLKVCNLPIAAPSANPSGYISPTTAQHVAEILGDKVSIIIDGGACQVGVESSVISLVGDQVILLRPGAITLEEIEEALGEKIALNIPTKSDDRTLLSPGLLLEHYAPLTQLKFIGELNETDRNKKIGVIRFANSKDNRINGQFDYQEEITLSSSGKLEEIAHNLFYTLREMDKLSLDIIAIERCDDKGLGRAIMDRLRRAIK